MSREGHNKRINTFYTIFDIWGYPFVETRKYDEKINLINTNLVEGKNIHVS